MSSPVAQSWVSALNSGAFVYIAISIGLSIYALRPIVSIEKINFPYIDLKIGALPIDDHIRPILFALCVLFIVIYPFPFILRGESDSFTLLNKIEMESIWRTISREGSVFYRGFRAESFVVHPEGFRYPQTRFIFYWPFLSWIIWLWGGLAALAASLSVYGWRNIEGYVYGVIASLQMLISGDRFFDIVEEIYQSAVRMGS